jgi:FMN phosphatase YigB (HAD superfamily)
MVSADYAVRKPNPLLFETAAARLGVPPRDIWFVGDRLDTDVAGATAVGMTTVWFNPERREVPPSAAVDLSAASWAAIVARLIPDVS